MQKTFIASLFIIAITSINLYANCAEKGSIRLLSNDFSAVNIVAKYAKAFASKNCQNYKQLLTNHRNALQVPALSKNPAEYTTVIVGNLALMPLVSNNLVRPLDDLVAKYGQDLSKQQLISIDGKIVAIAFLVITQHLFYQQDILKQIGIQKAPKSYEEILQIAEQVRSKGIMKYPLSGTYKAGWNLAAEFINMYLAYGGTFFKQGDFKLYLDDEKAMKTLQMLKRLSKYMPKEILSYDANLVQARWEAGKSAIVNLWGSRLEAFVDGKGSNINIEQNTKTAVAPVVEDGTIPATTLWWVGFTIAKNINQEDAKASFQAMLNATSSKVANEHPKSSAWLAQGYKTHDLMQSTIQSVKAGAKAYPMHPAMPILHSVLGTQIADYLQDKESAKKNIADIKAAYKAKAKQAGISKN